MDKRDDFNKKDHLLKILKGFPESFTADLLDKLSDSGFKRGEVPPDDFLEEKLKDTEFADNFMKLFEDYAKEEWLKDILQDKPKYLQKLLEGLAKVDADGDTKNVKRVIQEKLNQEDRGEAFISSCENFAENGKMHIFFYKIIGAKQLEELKPKIEKLEDLQSNIDKLEKLQSKIEKLEDQKLKNAKSKSLQSKIKNLKNQQSKIEKRRDLKSQIKDLKDRQSKIKKLKDLKSRIKDLLYLQLEIENLKDQKSQIKNLKDLQLQIESLKNQKSKIKNLKYLQANINNLLKSQPNIFLWWAAHPVLVSVESRQYNSRSEVWFKWVESRLWDERKTDSPMPDFVRRMERSVSYFIIDLKNQVAQLRIQHIRPNALKSLKEEYKQFRTEIDKLLGFFHFSRLPMEAVVKKFLSPGKIKPLKWEMQLPDDAYLRAKGNYKFFFSKLSKIPLLRDLGLGVIKRKIFFGRKLSCEFHLNNRDWGSPVVRIKVDGEKDVLTVLNEFEHLQMETITDTILRVNKNKVIDKNLKTFLNNTKSLDHLTSVERFLFERIVLSFDYHFTRLEDTEIKEGHLDDCEWLQKKIVKNARDRLCQQYPDNFISIAEKGNRVLVKK